MRWLVPVLAATLVIGPALADSKGGKPPKGGHSAAAHCPPGLAKKSPACVPPGQANKATGYTGYRVGDHLPPRYVWLAEPWRYGPPRDGSYVTLDGYVFRIDRGTAEVLAVLGLLDRLID